MGYRVKTKFEQGPDLSSPGSPIFLFALYPTSDLGACSHGRSIPGVRGWGWGWGVGGEGYGVRGEGWGVRGEG